MTLLLTATLVLLHGILAVEEAAAEEAAVEEAAPAMAQQHWLSRDRVFVPWSKQPARWFGAFEIDAGFLYLRPRFELGYGKPHSSWVGLDLNPIFTDEGVAGYAGLRVAQPYWHLRAGGRAWYTFYRSFLVPQHSYSVEDIERQVGRRSRFLTWEAELGADLPVGPGEVEAEVAGSYVTRVPDGFYVYEETLRVVVNPPWVWRARIGYLWEYFSHTLQLGPVVEAAGVPRRGMVVLRAGGLVRITLSGDLEARGTFIPPIVTRDPLGTRGGDAFLVGIRYRWATGP